MKPNSQIMWGNLWELVFGNATASPKKPNISQHSQPRPRFDSPYLHPNEGTENIDDKRFERRLECGEFVVVFNP